jgi:large subunit ribosomal protein L18
MSQSEKVIKRITRKKRIRKKIQGTKEKPRATVFRSLKHIYIQIINDSEGRVLLASSSLSKSFREKMKTGSNIQAAKLLGEIIAEEALKKNIKKIVFDRNGYLYHGRVKALADSMREKGMEF